MTQDNLMSNDNTDQVVIDESKDYLTELVGDDKKFKDVKALAKGKAYSDAHITLLEKRFDQLSSDYRKLKEDSAAGARMQDLLDKLDKMQPLTSRDDTVNSNEDKKPAFDQTELDSLVSSKIQQHEQTRTEQENFNKVKVKLVDRFGSNYAAALKEHATALGLTDEDVNLMARRNPGLFSKTFDLDAKPGETFQSPPKSNLNNFTPKAPEKRTWSYYLKMKDKDPKAWLDRKTAIQMEKDAQALGAAFYDV